LSDGDPLDVREPDPGLFERAIDDRKDDLHVPAGG